MPKITRLQREMQQFDEESYKTEFSDVIHVSEHTVQVTMKDGSIWTVIRNDNFMEPPQLFRYGEKLDIFCGESWSPAITSVCFQGTASVLRQTLRHALLLFLCPRENAL